MHRSLRRQKLEERELVGESGSCFLVGHFLVLNQSRYASSVVMACLLRVTPDFRLIITF